MNKPVKTKLCWNCEGNVSRTIENCPYCGVYLSPEPSDEKEETASVIKPHYSPEQVQKPHDIPKAPYTPRESSHKPQVLEKVLETDQKDPPTDLLKNVFIPLFLLSTGTIALIFAILLLLFSSKGKLLLEWDADSWYIYAILALPLLAFGWKLLEKK